MDQSTAFSVLFAILVVTQLIMIVLVMQNRRMMHPSPDGLLKASQAKTNSVIYKAVQQANKILVAAELKGLQLISRQKLTGNELSDQFRSHLLAIEKALQEQLEHNAQHADVVYNEFIKSAEATIQNHITANQKMLEDKSQTLITRTEGLLTEFTKRLEEKVQGDVDKELLKVAEEIDNYKATRMRIVDERIVDILEEIMRTVIGKKMSLADQSELIYKALEEAKKEHAFK